MEPARQRLQLGAFATASKILHSVGFIARLMTPCSTCLASFYFESCLSVCDCTTSLSNVWYRPAVTSRV
jgi:hypothetical protein